MTVAAAVFDRFWGNGILRRVMRSPPWVWGPRIEYGAGSVGAEEEGLRGNDGKGLRANGDEGRPSAQHLWIPAFAGTTIWANGGGHAVTAVASGEAKETRGSSQA